MLNPIIEKKICIGLFKGSPLEDCIHIAADVFGLIELQDVFKSLGNGMDRFDFSNLQLLDKKYRINLVAHCDPLNVGLKQTGNGTYEWSQTKAKWNEFRDNLLNLCYQHPEKTIELESGDAHKDALQVIFSFDDFKPFRQQALAAINNPETII